MVKKKTETETSNKLFADQYDDEEVLYMFRKHPIVMRKGFILACVAILVGPLATLALLYLRPNSPPSVSFFFLSLLASLVLSIIIFLPSWIMWFYSYFLVTDQRFIQISRKGLFNKTVVDMNLNQIQSMNYQVAGFVATTLGFGTIMIQTYMGDLVVHDIHHPAHIVKKLAMVLREQGVEPAELLPKQGADNKEEES